MKPMQFASPGDGIDHPQPRSILVEQRLAFEAGEGQFMGVSGNVETPARLAVISPDWSVHHHPVSNDCSRSPALLRDAGMKL